MSDYISKSALGAAMYHEAFETDSKMQKWDSGCWIRYKMFENALAAAPTIDAVPVVRCKDCKYYQKGVLLSPQKFCFRLRGKGGEAIGYNFAEDDFCSYGERSEDATD